MSTRGFGVVIRAQKIFLALNDLLVSEAWFMGEAHRLAGKGFDRLSPNGCLWLSPNGCLCLSPNSGSDCDARHFPGPLKPQRANIPTPLSYQHGLAACAHGGEVYHRGGF